MIETRQSVVVMSQEGGDITKVFFKMMCERGFHRLVNTFIPLTAISIQQ